MSFLFELLLKLASGLWPAPALALVALLMIWAIEPHARRRSHRNRRVCRPFRRI